jgi:hypothetical protein
MKCKSYFGSLLLLTAIFLMLSACSGNKKENESHTDSTHAEEKSESESLEVTAPQFDVPEEFQQQLASLFGTYLSLKDAFVSSDAEKVRSEAASTIKAVGKVDMKLLSGAAHTDWMAYLTSINNSLKDIEATNDLEAQRRAFSILSDNLYKTIKAFGLGGTEAFYEYCPMAFDNEGAYWLSDSEQIRNPYFGDKMLACGEVREKLQ